jgi:hypothetical protein
MDTEGDRIMYTIIGLGPNEIKIPLLFFLDKEEAEELLNENFEYVEQYNRWETNNGDDFSERDENNRRKVTRKARLLFVDGRHYGGCGECYALKIVEVEEGKPIVSWDLD